jgi:hypothetical protein
VNTQVESYMHMDLVSYTIVPSSFMFECSVIKMDTFVILFSFIDLKKKLLCCVELSIYQ